jgi:hypothetical protein
MIIQYEKKNIFTGFFSDDDVVKELVKDYCIQEGLEFDEKNITRVVETTEEFKRQRSVLLNKGFSTKDKRFYFTEQTAEKFVMDYSSLDDNEKLVWKDTSPKIVELTKVEAKPYVREIKTILRELYGLIDQ